MKKLQARRNLCQSCFQRTGRYILDCFCIICEKCYSSQSKKSQFCRYCGKQTKGNKIDTKDQGSINKISYLFENVQLKMGKINEVMKFQNQASNRYVEHMESELKEYKTAVSELIAHNPKLYEYFSKKIKFSDEEKNSFKRNFSLKGSTTVKNQHTKRQYSTNDLSISKSPQRSDNSDIGQMYGVKKVKKKDKKTNNFSGNVINKVGSLNYMTAIKNSERPVTPESSKLRINKMRQNEISKHYTRK